MTNHVHLIGIPQQEESLAKAIGRCHYHYTKYLNRSHGRIGHLWQNRFYSCPMDDAHAHNALAYVELNPLRGGMVKKPWDYRWSSAAVHCGRIAAPSWLDMTEWRRDMSAEEWIANLREFYRNDAGAEVIRSNTYTGRPLGNEAFIAEIECQIRRRVRPLPMGRPRRGK
jgi:putative transposase